MQEEDRNGESVLIVKKEVVDYTPEASILKGLMIMPDVIDTFYKQADNQLIIKLRQDKKVWNIPFNNTEDMTVYMDDGLGNNASQSVDEPLVMATADAIEYRGQIYR